MSRRFALTLALLLAVAGEAGAQSNVRPAPRLVRVPEMGARLLPRKRRPFRAFDFASRWTGRGAPRFASEVDELEAVVEPEEPVGFAELTPNAAIHDNAEFDSGGGDVAIARGGWSAAVGTRVGSERVLALTFDAEASFYDFTGAVDLMAGAPDPFNDVYDTRLGVMVLDRPGGERNWFAGFELGFSGEDDADFRDSFTVGGLGGVRFDVGDGASMSIGVAARSRLEDDPWVIPYFGFDLPLTERLRLVSEGSRIRAVLTASETLELDAGASYEMRQYRLNEDSALSEGVVQDEEITVGAGLRWRISEGVSLRAEGGAQLWREFSSYDATGVRIGEVETGDALYGALELSIVY